ncbi:MAG: Beta-carotene 15,15-monooxygenase [Bacteroidota bacterium]|nr:Beta-carotene 15,15-monooxygenase [Bacteroidota bacterium]
MLNFFKSNNPAVLVFYVIYLALFRVCAVFGPIDAGFVFSHKEPLSQIVFGLLKYFPNNYLLLSLVLSAVLCFLQAMLINNIVNENKILAKKNYLAGLLFIVFCSFFKESLVLSPVSLSLTFLILCTQKIFVLIKREKAFGDVFDVGLLIAIATLFYFPSILFIVFAYIGLAAVRPFTYKEWIIVLMGFLAPFILVLTFYVWDDRLALMLPDISGLNGRGWLLGPPIALFDRIILGELVIIMLFSLALLPGALYSSLIQVRKYTTSLVFLIFLIVISYFLQQTVNQSHWMLLALPVAIVFAMVLMQIKKRLFSEVIHLILILLVLAGQYLPLFNLI